jgi:hypothetical protein
LSLIADGDLTRESDTSLSDVSAQSILGQESLRRNQRKVRFSPSTHKHSIN